MTVTIDGTSGINTPGVVNTAAETIATTLAVTGVTTFAAGTAALPAITTTGDTNTGIFFPAADTIAFAEGGAEAMRITSAGNVGIGTSSPISILEVTKAGVTNVFLGYNGTSENYYDADTQIFRNAATTERARITSAGDFMVGTTVEPTGSTGGSAFMASSVGRRVLILACTTASGAGLAEFKNTNGRVGEISVSGSSTSYLTSSDYRLKNTIAPMTGALAKVIALKPCTYKWKVDGSDGQGFIAHELAEVAPGCVSGAKDAVDAEGNPEYQGIDTSFLVATLTAAIQEQQALITALTTRITALEGAA